ncbi:MAG: SpoIID/LytB domain-containing protein [Paludibacteraceae bacterium]|nr:SpoIID/LytB domain-containing protein [Paludibacteraceae bacterium]
MKVEVGICTKPEVKVDYYDGYAIIHDVMIGVQFHWQRFENQKFKGEIKILENPDGTKTAVNIIDVEEYLKSVISSEMSGTSMVELLKAHAIISRSWVIRKIQARKALSNHDTKTDVVLDGDGRHIAWYGAEPHLNFDVCADDHCQRYYGCQRATNPVVAEAVEATKGMVLTYNGDICDCRYHKCCGGKTERYSVCWEDADYPYLTPVEDKFCGEATPDVLRQVLNDYDLETRGYHDWEVTYSPDELRSIIKERSGIDFGTILDLTPVRVGESGRIYELKITGTLKTLTIGKELEIRKWLSHSHLYSSAFTVSRTADGGFRLTGKGWGHGVGLCQIGAAVMAHKGYNYKEILQHYYPGTEIKMYNV